MFEIHITSKAKRMCWRIFLTIVISLFGSTGLSLFNSSEAFAASNTVFSTDFDMDMPSEFSGITTTEGVQGYAGFGTDSDVFGGNFLRNTTAGNPAEKTILMLTGLPQHTSIDIKFLLAIIDSWDGGDGNASPDIFNITVDGTLIFSETFTNISSGHSASYPNTSTPSGVVLSKEVQLGFTPHYPWWLDSAYNMGLEPKFKNIQHTSSTLTVEWFASGGGWQGGTDESWAIDNLEVLINTEVIEVGIDIKPGSDPNSINPNSKGTIPVAILSSADFNAPESIGRASLTFGRTGSEASLASCKGIGEDANGDGLLDLICHFTTQQTSFQEGDVEGIIEGKTVDGTPITGKDSVQIVP